MAREVDDEFPHGELAPDRKLTIPDLVFDVIAEEVISPDAFKLDNFTRDRLSDFILVPSRSHRASNRNSSSPFVHEKHHHTFVFVLVSHRSAYYI
ncbi:MAG: hypothetical protein KBC16_00610 [Candidatus Pacebacteria bacterium]|nr:hypothetical protein [Candidatus Paceibacterota bacterium]